MRMRRPSPTLRIDTRREAPDTKETLMSKAFALVAALAAATMLATVSSGATKPATIDLVLPKTKSTYVDTGAKGYTRGDYFLATGPVLHTVGGERIGGLAGVWTLLGPTADNASITIHLDAGTLFVDGRIRHQAKTSVLRVLGGTRAYAGAHGTATFRYLSETSAALRIEIS
jgi:hypothetical protein